MIEKKALEQSYIARQLELKEKIDFKHFIRLEDISLLAGVDLAYWKKEEKEYAVCCIVVLDYFTKQIVEKRYFVDQIKVPYIPGCLAFREIPLFLKTKELLLEKPDIYIFDGNGYLHPRHMGMATHAGILLQQPTIGVAKTYYKIGNVEYSMPEDTAFAFRDIVIENQVYGRVVRTHPGVKPIFLSVGNQIELDTAMKIVESMTEKESHIPLPTRLADIMTHEIRRQYNI